MRRVSAVVPVVLALLVAGCGGDGKDEYVKEFNTVGTTLEKTLTTLGGDITGSTDPKQIATKLDDGAEALDAAAKDLDELEPPDDAQSSHDKIVSGVKDLASTFRKGADEAQAGDLTKLVATFQSIEGSGGATKIKEAQRELKDKGYEVEE